MNNEAKSNKLLINHLQSGIATAKGVDGDFVYITVGDAKRILKAFGVEEETVENGYLGMVLTALACHVKGPDEEKKCKYCHYSQKGVSCDGSLYLCNYAMLIKDTINLLKYYADELRKEKERNGNN